MPNFEVTISPEYVGNWGLTDAFRELFQNAVDQQTVNPANEMLLTYDPDLLLLRIGNRESNLDPSTLLLGRTTKAADKRLIGQFGEGYKLALIVLLRLGKSVTIYNRPDVWTPSIKHSAQFNAPLLNINTVKYRFKQCPEHDLLFEISGVTPEEYAAIQDTNRYFHPERETLEHEYGKILLDPMYKGKLYVSGLFVTDLEHAWYGYDIKPEHLDIGRDRDLVDQFAVYWKTAVMWASQPTQAETVNRLIAEKAMDVEHIRHQLWEMPKHTKEYIISGFYRCHGCNAVPVTSEAEAKKARLTYGTDANIVIVSENLKSILASSPQFKEISQESILGKTPAQILQAALNCDVKGEQKYRKIVKRSVLEEMLKLAEYWTWKK